ncbi:hydantoinase/oxoprolinase family protein [Virgibacillus proomii]|uniref:hydantoinase/oxoprolinase family protein n=1 Tax=Virgibacillus proomii TaxID=84407 RepID=UPI001C11CA2E|nr:hydantoinase/oxoprolinase family protein [Virgibacillus proomii]MBU5267124.1 hydantoinase/oxoprolinase family protein [Virgibacillus proomii]
MSKLRVAVDVGGTFTDVFVFDEISKKIYVEKTSSTPANPEIGVIEGLEKANIPCEEIMVFSHGTTAGTNALIERKLPNTALITTKGFRDAIEIRRGTKLDLWDAYKDVAEPYIKRRDRFEVTERTDYSGHILVGVNEQEVKELAHKLKRRGVEAIAICFLNAYINGENERITRNILKAYLPDVFITISSDILPEIFEHERMSTTMINAVLGPKISNYIKTLENKLEAKGYKGEILVMHSGGGVMTSENVQRYAGRLASSGIAAGAIASKYIANLCGFKNAIGLDMGGTSTDISLVYDGKLKMTKDWYIEYGYPIGFPSIEILTIGAGGGSLAWIDAGGSLRNGPESAGSDPGPASYDKGGTQPTNTDANLILGRLSPSLLDGQMQLKKEHALQSLQPICETFGYTHFEAADAILKVANANMSDALRLISVRKGYDPRDFVLVAFGGAGGLHSAYLAKELHIPHVIIPAYPGVAAAFGCLLVDYRHDLTQTYVADIKDVDKDDLNKAFAKLEEKAIKLLEKEKVSPQNMQLIRYLEMRYAGQWRSLAIIVNRPIVSLNSALDKFHQEHERAFAFSNPDQKVEIYGLRVEAIGTVPKPELAREKPSGSLQAALKGYREVYFAEKDGLVRTPIYNRPCLPVDSLIHGPAIVEQLDSTVIIPPEFTATVDEYKNIIIHVNIGGADDGSNAKQFIRSSNI